MKSQCLYGERNELYAFLMAIPKYYFFPYELLVLSGIELNYSLNLLKDGSIKEKDEERKILKSCHIIYNINYGKKI